MGRGFSGIRTASAQIEERKTQGGGSFFRYFRLPNPGDSAVVRFLEQDDDINWAWMVRLPPKGNQKFGDFTPTLDQKQDGTGPDCPFLKRGMKPQVKGYLNVIWRDAPVFQKDSDGKFVKDQQGRYIQTGTQDDLAVWEVGIMVLDDLDGINSTYKGLMSRDFRIVRKGSGLNTKYNIDPADPDAGPQPMSQADLELASNKYDLTPVVTPKSYEDAEALLTGGGTSRQQQTQAPVDNPFLRSRT